MNQYDKRVKELKGEFLGARRGKQPIHISEATIQEAEKQLGFTLPTDYREFVSDYGNFGFFYGATFPVKTNLDGVEAGSFEIFYNITTAQEKSLQDIISSYHNVCDDERWPKEWLPIAEDAGGNSVAICIEGAQRGAVAMIYNHIWDPEAQNIYVAADSFDEFMQLIYLRNDE